MKNEEQKIKDNIPRLSSQADLHMETYKTEKASTTEDTCNWRIEDGFQGHTLLLFFLHGARWRLDLNSTAPQDINSGPMQCLQE